MAKLVLLGCSWSSPAISKALVAGAAAQIPRGWQTPWGSCSLRLSLVGWGNRRTECPWPLQIFPEEDTQEISGDASAAAALGLSRAGQAGRLGHSVR